MSKVELVRKKGPTSVYIDAEVTDDGDLLFSGQDIGKAPSEFFGDSDYEYWLQIKAVDKDQLLLSLVEKIYSRNTKLISDIMEHLNLKNIAYDFHSYA